LKSQGAIAIRFKKGIKAVRSLITRARRSADAAAKALVGSTVAGAKGTIAGAEMAAATNQLQNLSGRKDPCK
jgi:hypothetical protein